MENLRELSLAELNEVNGGKSLIPIPVGGLGAIIFHLLSTKDLIEGYQDATK